MVSPLAKIASEIVENVRTTPVSDEDLRKANNQLCESYKALIPPDYPSDWKTDKEAAAAWTSYAKKKNETINSFMCVSKDENGNYILPKGYSSATEVGGLQEIVHLTLHDIMSHAVICRAIELECLDPQNANAVYIDYERFERLDEYYGKTYFQPLKLDK